MAQAKSGANAPMTAAEMQQWITDHEKQLKNYAAIMDPIKLRDVTKGTSRRIDSLTKDKIVTYLKEPIKYEKQLRNASYYIFYRSQIYQRIVMYYATLFCLDARTVIPNYDLIKSPSDQDILKQFNDTTKMLSKWNINAEFLKVIVTCFLQDVSYNCAYYDETGLFLLPLPPDYCRIYGQYQTSDYSFCVDMSYFNGKNKWFIDEWGEPFTSMFEEYETTRNKWVRMPDKYAACWKVRSYDLETILPLFCGILGDLVQLNDVQDVQNIADQAEIYKLIYLKLKTITGAKMPDEWAINPASAMEYFSRLINEALPDYVSAAIIPTNDDLGVIDFSNTDKATETNKVLRATKSVLNTSGGAQILNSADITGSTAFNATLIADTEFATNPLLYEIEGWFNRIMQYCVSKPAQIKFFRTGRLILDTFRKNLLEDAQYSLPTKLAIMSINGIDPMQALSLNHLEEDILKLGDRFNDPLRSSYTSSGNDEGGRPTLDDDQISDSGESSREKSDKAN